MKQFRFNQGDDPARLDQFLNAGWGADGEASFLAVAKPLESAGSDGVTRCESFAEVFWVGGLGVWPKEEKKGNRNIVCDILHLLLSLSHCRGGRL